MAENNRKQKIAADGSRKKQKTVRNSRKWQNAPTQCWSMQILFLIDTMLLYSDAAAMYMFICLYVDTICIYIYQCAYVFAETHTVDCYFLWLLYKRAVPSFQIRMAFVLAADLLSVKARTGWKWLFSFF